MSKPRPLLLAFNGGEAGKQTLARVDLDIYSRFSEVFSGVFADLRGGMSKAPGTLYVDEAYNSEQTYLRSFTFNDDDNVVLMFSGGRLGFMSGDFFLTAGSGDVTLGSWTDESAVPDTGGGDAPGDGTGGIFDPYRYYYSEL